MGGSFFFLKAIIHQCFDNEYKANSILNLYNKIQEKITPQLKSEFSTDIIHNIFKSPVFTINKISKEISASKITCTRVINSLKDMGIVKVIRESKGNNPAIFVFTESIKIVEG